MTPASSPSGSEPRLKHFPVSFFAVVMGLGGLTLATQELQGHFDGISAISFGLLVTTIAVFVVLAGIYLAKAIRYPEAIASEWAHPVRMSFFPAVSISLILIGTALFHPAPTAALVFWSLGTALHLIGTLAVVSAWIGHRPFETLHLNPAWFIPAVGNILVPIAGVRLGFVEISWFFFSVGLLFWLVLLTLVFNRLIFHNAMPAKLMPTLVILIAPPALGLLAYQQLVPGLDSFSRVLYNAAVLFFLIIASQAGKLIRLPYALSWWAYSFPLAGLTVATLRYSELSQSLFHHYAGIALYALLIAVIVVLIVTTVGAIRRDEICQPEG